MLRVNVEPGASYSQLKEVPEIQKVVIEEAIYAIKEGIAKNKTSISLFEVAYSDYYIELKKDKWKPTLEKAPGSILTRSTGIFLLIFLVLIITNLN